MCGATLSTGYPRVTPLVSLLLPHRRYFFSRVPSRSFIPASVVVVAAFSLLAGRRDERAGRCGVGLGLPLIA
jgi:hypothetical protein